MAWTGLFKDAATTGKRELTVKRDSYNESDAVAIETWSDDTLFKVRGLNHLRVMGFVNMISFSPLVSQLTSLLELILTNNGLESLPIEIGTLTRLRLLDASHNRLKLLPQTIYHLGSLQKLLLAHNELTTDSFPVTGEQDVPFPALQYVNISNNQLTILPQFIYMSTSLIELLASYNELHTISTDIYYMSSLKTIDMSHNNITSLPSEISQCSKLRSLCFDDNPLTDPRLVKILKQFGVTKPKAVLEYLQGSKKSSGKGGKKKKGHHGATPIADDIDTRVDIQGKYIIHVVKPAQYVVIKSMNAARNVRPYLVCSVLHNILLTDIDMYRLFFTVQVRKRERER